MKSKNLNKIESFSFFLSVPFLEQKYRLSSDIPNGPFSNLESIATIEAELDGSKTTIEVAGRVVDFLDDNKIYLASTTGCGCVFYELSRFGRDITIINRNNHHQQ